MEKEKAVAQLVFLLIFLGTLVVLIVVGTKLNMYLFSQGALGSSRYSRVHPIGSLAVVERPSAEQRFYSSRGDEEDQSSRYARRGIALMSIVLFVVVMVAVSLVAAPH